MIAFPYSTFWWWYLLLRRMAATPSRSASAVAARATTLPAGSAATASVTQADGVTTFAFGIPQGEPGATGSQGPAGADGGFAPVAGETGVYRATASNGTTVDITIAPDGSGSGYTMTAAAAGA